MNTREAGGKDWKLTSESTCLPVHLPLTRGDECKSSLSLSADENVYEGKQILQPTASNGILSPSYVVQQPNYMNDLMVPLLIQVVEK